MRTLPYKQICNFLNFNDCTPVVNLIAAKEVGRGKFYSGIARACFNIGATLIDSAISSGVEQFAMRRGKIIYFILLFFLLEIIIFYIFIFFIRNYLFYIFIFFIRNYYIFI